MGAGAHKAQENAMSLIQRFIRDEAAATAIEYAMIAGFISIAIVAGLRTIGQSLQNKFYGPLAANLS
jgi:pilus assembly protein Flp/PilA